MILSESSIETQQDTTYFAATSGTYVALIPVPTELVERTEEFAENLACAGVIRMQIMEHVLQEYVANFDADLN